MKETMTFGVSGSAIDGIDAIYNKCVELGALGSAGPKQKVILDFIENQERRATNWQETARQSDQDRIYYRDLLTKIGEHFGVDAKRALDGVVHEDVLILNIEPLVVSLLRRINDSGQTANKP